MDVKPLPPRHLSELEARLVGLSNGTRSLKEILEAVRTELGDAADGPDMVQRGLRFFREAFSRHWAVAFREPWEERSPNENSRVCTGAHNRLEQR